MDRRGRFEYNLGMLRVNRWACGATLVALIFGSQAPSTQTILTDHPGQYSAADIEMGSRLYAGQCALCHGPNGDTVAGIDLRRGQFRRAVSDEDLRTAITNGNATAGMPGFKLTGAELDEVIAFIRAGFDASGGDIAIGDTRRGRTIFEGTGECATCHRVNGQGPRLAPDLSDIGAVRTPAALQRSLLDPTTAMWPINRSVRITLRDGRTVQGRRLNEDTFSVQLIDDHEALVSLAKSDIRNYEISKTSPMPSFRGRLAPAEIADLLAYLLSLKGLR